MIYDHLERLWDHQRPGEGGAGLAETKNRGGNDVQNVKQALLGMIPSVGAYSDFKDDMGKAFSRVMPALFDYAAAGGLIREKDEAAFLAFLEANPASHPRPDENRTFSDLLAQVLGAKSVNSLLERLNTYAERFGIMPIQASMLSRLKKHFHPNTPQKRNALRLLAFWLGLKRPELGWNYEMLLHLAGTRAAEPAAVEEKEGVRVSFALQAVGDILDAKAVDWLKSELYQCINDLNLSYVKPGHIAFTLSTAHIDIPKAPGPSGEPRLYAKAIRDSLALAYQMPIRWVLSEHSNPFRSITIAISAGPFDQADKYIQALLSARTKGITPIRLTEFARLCARLADIKVTFSKEAERLDVGFLEETYINVWHVDYFWSYLYYDFVPALLDAEVLPTTFEAYEALRKEIFFPDQVPSKNKALAALRKFPQDTLLAIEFARCLMAKRLFFEADEILSTILASYPLHVVARSCRMDIYFLLSRQHPDPAVSENFFSRAAGEVSILLQFHGEQAQVYTEAGMVYYVRAVHLICSYRKKREKLNWDDLATLIRLNLEKAKDLFDKSATLSPITEFRAEFWKRQTRILLTILQADEETIVSGQPITDKFDIIYKTSVQSWTSFGWIPEDTPAGYRFFFERLKNLQPQFAQEIAVTNWFPSLKCLFAIHLWNTLPLVTVGMAKLIIALCLDAIQDVERLIKYNIGVFAASGCYTHVQTPGQFIRSARTYIRLLEEALKNDLNLPDDTVISRDKIRRLALPFALLDDEVESDIILKTHAGERDGGTPSS